MAYEPVQTSQQSRQQVLRAYCPNIHIYYEPGDTKIPVIFMLPVYIKRYILRKVRTVCIAAGYRREHLSKSSTFYQK
jgi:hypothetical protein